VSGSGASVGTAGASNAGPGVQGSSNSSQGIIGYSGSNVGAQGVSGSSFGMIGDTRAGAGVIAPGILGRAPANVGVYGLTSSGTGVLGVATGGGNAGVFQGNVVISGDFAASGMKSRVVPNRDGLHRTLYCLESPEPWFEDFGDAQLDHGFVRVKLPADFAEVVVGDAPYHVFLQPKGDCLGLYVTNQNSDGFDVRERQGGTSGVGFTFRLIVKQGGLSPEQTVRLKKVQVDAPGTNRQFGANGVVHIQTPPIPSAEEVRRTVVDHAPRIPAKP
jgi:hypothetical protein